MCTFRASCCSARLSRAQVLAFVSSSIQDRKALGQEFNYFNSGTAGSVKLNVVTVNKCRRQIVIAVIS